MARLILHFQSGWIEREMLKSTLSYADYQLQRYWHKRRRTWKESCQWISNSKKKPTGILKASHRQFDYYFLNYNFLPGGTRSIFDDYLWDNINILKLKSLFFRNPPPTLLHPEKWCRGFNHFISQWVFFFVFLLKTAYSARPKCANLKTEFCYGVTAFHVFDYSFLLIDSRPCLTV